MTILYPAASFFVGIIVGLTGVGGGSLMTPVLILLFGVHPAQAVGTDLLFAAATKGVGTAVHGVNRTVEWRIVRRLAMGSLPAAFITLLVLQGLGQQTAVVNRVMTTTLAVALVLTALSLLWRGRVADRAGGDSQSSSPERPAWATVITGMVVGVLVTLSSVGAGAIGMAVLVLLYPTVPLVRLVGADIAHAVPLTLMAGLGHWWLGDVQVDLLLLLLLGSVPGIVIGSQLAQRLPQRAIRLTLAGLLAVVGAKLLL